MARRKRSGKAADVPAHRPVSGPESQRVARTVQQAISIGEVVSVGVLNLVRSTLVTAVAGARDVSGELAVAATAAVRASIRAAGEVGGDLGLVAKQAIKGAIQATQEIGGDVGLAARSAARGAVKTADEVGGDVGKVANRAVEGVVEAGREIGGDVGSLARNAVEGAIEAADRVGSAAGRSVRATLSQAVVGIRSLVGALERPGGTSPEARAAAPRAARRKRAPVERGVRASAARRPARRGSPGR